MNADNVITLNGSSNTTVEQTVQWLEGRIKAGHLKLATGRLHITALKQIASALQPGEPRDVESVLERVDELAGNWARLNSSADSSTIDTYAKKARRLLEWHRAFLSDPRGFKFDIAERESKASEGATPRKADAPANRKPAPAKQAAPAPATQPAEQQGVVGQSPHGGSHAGQQQPSGSASPGLVPHRVRLGEGRYAKVEVPEDLSLNEALRVLWVLVPHCRDFDPTNQEHVALMKTNIV